MHVIPSSYTASTTTYLQSIISLETDYQVKSTVLPPPLLPSLANLACALSARRLRRLLAYSVAPLVSVPGVVMALPEGPRLLVEVGIGMGGGGGAMYNCPLWGSMP